jgi:hypothetical protein
MLGQLQAMKQQLVEAMARNARAATRLLDVGPRSRTLSRTMRRAQTSSNGHSRGARTTERKTD